MQRKKSIQTYKCRESRQSTVTQVSDLMAIFNDRKARNHKLLSPELAQRITEDVNEIESFVKKHNLNDMPIAEAFGIQDAAGCSFLQLICLKQVGAVVLNSYPHLLELITSELLNDLYLKSADGEAGKTIVCSPIMSMFFWQQLQIPILTNNHHIIFPKMAPNTLGNNLFLYSGKSFLNMRMLEILYGMGKIGLDHIEQNPGVIDYLLVMKLANPEFLAECLKVDVGIRLLERDNGLLMDHIVQKYMERSIYLPEEYRIHMVDNNAVLTILHEDEKFITQLKDFLSTFFAEHFRPAKIIIVKNEENKFELRLACSIVDLGLFINAKPQFPNPRIPSTLPAKHPSSSNEPTEVAKKKKKKKKKPKSTTAAVKAQLEVAPQPTPSKPQKKNTVHSQEINVRMWETELNKLFLKEAIKSVKTGGAKKRGNFHFNIEINSNQKFFAVNKFPNTYRPLFIKKSDYLKLLVDTLNAAGNMTVEQTETGLKITPINDPFILTTSQLSRFRQALIALDPGATIKPSNRVKVTHSENINTVSERLADRGYVLYFGSQIEDEILESMAKDKNTTEDNPECSPKPMRSKRDIDAVLFTSENYLGDCGFQKNHKMVKKGINLHNSTKELRTELNQSVDLVLVNPTEQSVDENIYARDFAHSAVAANAAGQVFDLTGRGIDAILNNELVTAHEDSNLIFKNDAVCLLRAMKWLYRGKKCSDATAAALKNWDYASSNVDRTALYEMLASHLSKYDNKKYVELLMEYGLLEKLFGISPALPIDKIIQKLRQDYAKLTPVDYALLCPLVTEVESSRPLEVTNDYFNNRLNLRIIKTVDGLEFPIDPDSGLPLAKDVHDNIFPLSRICLKAHTNRILKAPLLDKTNVPKHPIDVAKYSNRDGVEYIQEFGGYLYPLDYFSRPFARDILTKNLFHLNRPLRQSKVYNQPHMHFFNNNEQTFKPKSNQTEKKTFGKK